MKIQLFATRQEVVDLYTQGIEEATAQKNALATEKQDLIDAYESEYNDRLDQYNNLMNTQQQNVDTWANTQKELQQNQYDYNVGVINQNKQEAAENTEKEVKDAYVDYMKQNNQYGGMLETLALNGLATQGFSESSKIAIYNTYQNRVGTAKAALTKANADYDNQIAQAKLNNDSALAEIALEQMQKSYEIALQGFEYRDNLYGERLSYLQSVEDNYFNKTNTLENRIASYNAQLEDINQYQEQMEAQRQQRELEKQQWQQEFAEKQRQYNLSLAEEKRQYNESLKSKTTTNETEFTDGNSTQKRAKDLSKFVESLDNTLKSYGNNNTGKMYQRKMLQTWYKNGSLTKDEFTQLAEKYGL